MLVVAAEHPVFSHCAAVEAHLLGQARLDPLHSCGCTDCGVSAFRDPAEKPPEKANTKSFGKDNSFFNQKNWRTKNKKKSCADTKSYVGPIIAYKL